MHYGFCSSFQPLTALHVVWNRQVIILLFLPITFCRLVHFSPPHLKFLSHPFIAHYTVMYLFITSSHVPACTIHRPSLLQRTAIPSCHYCCPYCPPAFITHVFPTELILVGYLKMDEASTSKIQLFRILIIQYTNLYYHGTVMFCWLCIPL
jgi:hypothetical protein